MPALPRCTDAACDMDGFLLHRDQPWCGAHFQSEGGVI